MKTAVITGGAGGLGRALTVHLQARGWFCALLDLPHALGALNAGPAQSLHACDVTDPAAVARVCADIRAARPSIDLAIYNAGVTLIAPFARVEAAAHRRVFEINYWGAVNLAAALLPDIRAAGGTHLAITSVAGFAPLKHRTAYAASKHALSGFFGSLRGEEAAFGVRTVLAAPSFVATNPGARFDAQGLGPPGAAGDGVDEMTPETAAKTILAGLDKGRDFIPVGRVAGLAWWVNRLAPKLYERQMLKSIAGESA
ncbi:SDR family NAD(P)-dependent oxidoreductase [Pararhodobacter sp.]|uniref:SDR family NAD(P)-dependent oxidoreductase n=1 Tax=Pararhodobacter sp. TaxID=2127056 RepID=UPI002AFDECF2|nr:SDR family NAD(P)-dependent oxidoreductase [Pararhodobacter sp.]